MTKAKVPPMPKDPEKLKIWLERLRARVELTQYEISMAKHAVDMARIAVDVTKIETERLASIAERHKIATMQEKNAIEMSKLRMDIKKQEHEETLNDAKSSNALVYSFYSAVYEDTVSNAVKTIDEWSRVHPGKDINIQLTSPGGSVMDGLALYDFLRSLSARGHKIIVTCFGECASMGSILLQAGDERKMGENSYIMLHEVSYINWGKTSEHEEELAFVNILQNRLMSILCARSKLTPKILKEMWRKKDIWIDSKKSLKLGLVDSIIK